MSELKNYNPKQWRVCKFKKITIVISFLLFPLLGQAGQLSQANPVAINMMTYVQVIFGLIFVLGIFLLIAYLFKRITKDTYLSSGNNTNRMRIIDSLNINTRDRLLLVEVENTPVLISSASGKIERLHVFAERQVQETHDVENV